MIHGRCLTQDFETMSSHIAPSTLGNPRGNQPSQKVELHTRLCKKIADLTRVIDKLFRQFYEQSGALHVLQKKYRLQNEGKVNIEMERARYADEVKSCKEELIEQQKRNQSLNELINSIKVQLADCQIDKENALTKVDDLQQSLLQANRELDELKSVNSKLLMKSKNECNPCKDHVELIGSLKQDLEQNSILCIELTEEKDELHKKLNELESQYITTNNECQQLKEQVGNSEEVIHGLQSEKQNLQLKITHLLKELQELRSIVALKRDKVMSDSPIPPLPNRRKEYWLQTRPKVSIHGDLYVCYKEFIINLSFGHSCLLIMEVHVK